MPLSSIARRSWQTLAIVARWLRLETVARTRRASTPSSGEGREVVLLADSFPPIVNGGVYRPLSLVRFATKHGWRVTVHTKAADRQSTVGEALAARVPAEVTVHRLIQNLPRLPAAIDVDGGLANALLVVESVLAAPSRPRVVIATGPQFHNFVAGLLLKQLVGSKLVLDYRDEWSECPFDFVQKGRANAWWEDRCLGASDLVIFTTPSMRLHALQRFPTLDESKTCVVENGSEADDGESHERSEILEFMRTDDRTSICFLGSLGQHTDPSSFLMALNQVLERRAELRNSIRILWIGNQDPERLAAIAALDRFGVSRCFGQVSQAEARLIMEHSRALLLIVNREMDRYRPGKLYSYLAARPPILVFGSSGETGQLVSELRAGVVVDNGDSAELEGALATMLASPDHQQDNPKRHDWVSRHTRDILAGRLFDHVDALLT